MCGKVCVDYNVHQTVSSEPMLVMNNGAAPVPVSDICLEASSRAAAGWPALGPND